LTAALGVKQGDLVRNLIVVVILAAIGYFIYAKSGGSSGASTGSYSLATVTENPIPRDTFFALWTEQARKACPDARTKYNLSPAECEEKISEKAVTCTSSLAPNAPLKLARLTSPVV
jgi:hypothetical protein